MADTQYSLNWDAFQSSMCSGLSSFQQNGEFVDMTIAADGHMVKVHQIVMALASPFLKELINNAQCPHPVVFLNNVKHSILCDLLEYIYTGEVLINANNLSEFMTAAKGLHIRGLDNMGSIVEERHENFAVPTPRVASKRLSTASDLKQLVPQAKRIALSSNNTIATTKPESDMFSYEDESIIGTSSDWQRDPPKETSSATSSLPNLQFTVSNRGSLQVILNRYLYNLHSTAQQASQRRWRCVDYRGLRCPAYVVTKDNVVVNRSNLHNHTFHDKKILSKIERKAVFSHLDDVKGVKGDSKEGDATGDDDSFNE